MEEVVKAYLAGLVDGEGSIFITEHNRKYYTRAGERKEFNRMVTCYDIGVKVVMLSKEAVAFFAEHSGGTLKPQKAGWYAAVWHHKAYLFLKEILPYLITKKTQAEYAIWCHETIFSRANRDHYHRTERDKEIQKAAYEFFKLLNNADPMIWHGKSDEFGERLRSLGGDLMNMLTPSQASVGMGTEEGVTTTQVSPNNNPEHEPPTPLN